MKNFFIHTRIIAIFIMAIVTAWGGAFYVQASPGTSPDAGGPAHYDRDENIGGQAEFGSDGHLSIRNRGFVCEWIGISAEVLPDSAYSSDSILFGCKRGYSRLDEGSCNYTESSGGRKRRFYPYNAIRRRSETASVLSVRQRGPLYVYSTPSEQELAVLEKVCICRLTGRKEVRHV